jgi:putative ABC transport system permease protein
MGAFFQDVRFAARLLRRQPSFSIVAIATLALGIGATTAVFTVVDGVLLRPLPYRDPGRIVLLMNGRGGVLLPVLSPLNYLDVVSQSGVFTESAAMDPSSASLTGFGDPQQIDGAQVTAGFFGVLGVQPTLGRGFVEADANGTRASVVVIGDGLWRRVFGARSEIVGSTIRMDGKPYTIIGIAPPDLALPRGAQYWVPFQFTSEQLAESQRGAQWVATIERVRPGVSFEQALAKIDVVGQRLAHDFPRTNKDRAFTAIRLQDRIVRGVRPALLILLGAVTLVLLVACVNVANLLLARANGRAHEVAVRAAIGAARRRLVQQFLAESVVLGVAGGAGGLLVATWITKVLIAIGPASIPRLSEVGIDWRVLAFTTSVALGTSICFGLMPAFAATSVAVGRFISTATRGSIGQGSPTSRRVLAVCEVALAVTLLVGAGLLIRSYQRLTDVNPGFTPDHVLTFTIGLPGQKYPTGRAIAQFVERYLGQLEATPGALSAAGVYGLPLDDNFTASSSFTRPGESDSGDTPSVGMRVVTPDYFKTLGIPLKAGRILDARDNEDSQQVVLINAEMARRFWPDMDPIGQRIHIAVRLTDTAARGDKTIVGVVGDVKYRGLDAEVVPEVYVPHAQQAVDSMTIAVRTAGDPLSFAPLARSVLASVDREMPIASVRSMDDVIGRSLAERRFAMLLLASFAAIGVLLATIGVYGVLAYMVAQRTQEIGLRLAIGASPADVVQLFAREGVVLAGLGLVGGLLTSLVAAKALTGLLFGVTATDPITLASVSVVLAGAAVCASYFPARRAASVDPMEALRHE